MNPNNKSEQKIQELYNYRDTYTPRKNLINKLTSISCKKLCVFFLLSIPLIIISTYFFAYESAFIVSETISWVLYGLLIAFSFITLILIFCWFLKDEEELLSIPILGPVFYFIFFILAIIPSLIFSLIGAFIVGLFDVITFPFRFAKANFEEGNIFTAIFTIIACLFFVAVIIFVIL